MRPTLAAAGIDKNLAKLRAAVRIGELSAELETGKGNGRGQVVPSGGKYKVEALAAAGISISTALTIPACAAALGVPVSTLRHWIRTGAPVVRRGHKGTGDTTLLDPAAVRTWRDSRLPAVKDHKTIVEHMEHSTAEALYSAWRSECGPRKVSRAQLYITLFLEISHNNREPLGLPDISAAQLPEQIQQMRAAYSHSASSGTVKP